MSFITALVKAAKDDARSLNAQILVLLRAALADRPLSIRPHIRRTILRCAVHRAVDMEPHIGGGVWFHIMPPMLPRQAR